MCVCLSVCFCNLTLWWMAMFFRRLESSHVPCSSIFFFQPMKRKKGQWCRTEMILVFVIWLLEIEDLLDPIPFCPFAPLVTIDSVTRYNKTQMWLPLYAGLYTNGGYQYQKRSGRWMKKCFLYSEIEPTLYLHYMHSQHKQRASNRTRNPVKTKSSSTSIVILLQTKILCISGTTKFLQCNLSLWFKRKIANDVIHIWIPEQNSSPGICYKNTKDLSFLLFLLSSSFLFCFSIYQSLSER